MDADRLVELLTTLEAEFADGYEDYLAALIRAYVLARDTPAQDHAKAIAAAMTELRDYLIAAPQNDYPPSKIAMLRRLNAEELFGTAALTRIETAVREAHSGPATVVKALEAFRTELTDFKTAAAEVCSGLAAMGVETTERLADECEVGVLIPTRLTNAKLGPLSEQLKQWNQILRVFAELAGDPESEITVRAISSGSVELYVIAACSTASLLVTALDKLADLYKKILEIQTLRVQLRKLDAPVLETDKIKEHEQKTVKAGIEELVRELIKQAPAKIDSGRRHELKTELTMRVTQVARFIDDGGSVEVSAPPDEPDEQDEQKAAAEGVDETSTPGPKPDAAAIARKKDIDRVKASGAIISSLPRRDSAILQLASGSDPAPNQPEAK